MISTRTEIEEKFAKIREMEDRIPSLSKEAQNSARFCIRQFHKEIAELREKALTERPKHRKRERRVIQIIDGKDALIYETVRDATKNIGLSANAIYKVLCGHQKTAGGYGWRYE